MSDYHTLRRAHVTEAAKWQMSFTSSHIPDNNQRVFNFMHCIPKL